MSLNLRLFIPVIFLGFALSIVAVGQENVVQPENKEKKKEKPQKTEKPAKTEVAPNALTAEQIAETTLIIFGGYGGRITLQQIRRTSVERGKIQLLNADGTRDNVNYERRILRGENLEKEKIRLDQEFPNARYALIFNQLKVQGIFNDTVFIPREDASKAFQNQIWHGLDALLRYKENGSTIAISKRDKYMGVDYAVVDVTDKQGRITKFAVSAKTYRVMWLEYTDDSIKYTRKFYDYRIAQGTLVSYRNVLFANDKQVEETNISTVTFGQKVDEALFELSN